MNRRKFNKGLSIKTCMHALVKPLERPFHGCFSQVNVKLQLAFFMNPCLISFESATTFNIWLGDLHTS